MGRNAYLIVTDLHFSYKNLRNRYDYRAEVLDACKFIINLAADYKRKGYTITLLLLGDVFTGVIVMYLMHALITISFTCGQILLVKFIA